MRTSVNRLGTLFSPSLLRAGTAALSSKRFHDVLAKLEETYEIVIIDSPPAQLISDSLILAGLANALVFVVRADAMPYQVAKRPVHPFRLQHANHPKTEAARGVPAFLHPISQPMPRPTRWRRAPQAPHPLSPGSVSGPP